jgi:RND family efflux transporter MFP subunit
MGIVGAIGYLGILPTWSGVNSTEKALTTNAKRATLSITVAERGNIESQVTVDGVCELTGSQNKISYLVPEGSKVKKGDVVCKFDDAEIKKHIAEQEIKVKQAVARIETTQQEMEIQRTKGESDVIAAKVDRDLALLDLEKYQKGDYPAEYTKAEGEMQLKKKDLEAESAKLDQYKALMKKGFKTSEDVRIQNTLLASKQLDYSSSKQFLDVKQKYEYKRKSTEFSSKADQNQKKVEQAQATAKAQVSKAMADYDAAKATAKIEESQLDEYQKQKEKAIMKAEQGGIVAYSNDRYWDASSQVREGATVYSRQKIFSLPDMTRMQVKVNIHESLIKKIKVGQKAEVRIDAFPNVVFVGTVKSVSQLADSTRPWMSGGVKEYTTIVTLNEISGYELKPGMTAEARILVGELKNVLVVPVSAVAENKGDFYAFVEEPGGIKLRKVKVGENNEKLVEILEGLKEGESVALDARTRAAAEFKSEETKDQETKEGPKSQASSPLTK